VFEHRILNGSPDHNNGKNQGDEEHDAFQHGALMFRQLGGDDINGHMLSSDGGIGDPEEDGQHQHKHDHFERPLNRPIEDIAQYDVHRDDGHHHDQKKHAHRVNKSRYGENDPF